MPSNDVIARIARRSTSSPSTTASTGCTSSPKARADARAHRPAVQAPRLRHFASRDNIRAVRSYLGDLSASSPDTSSSSSPAEARARPWTCSSTATGRTRGAPPYAVTGSRELADDAAQEAVEKAFGALDRYDVTRPFGPWLKRIAVNRAIDHLHRDRRSNVLRDEDVVLHGWAVGEGAADELRLWAVTDAVAALAATKRAVVVLHYWLDLPLEEIAGVLGLPVGTVASRLARAKAELRVTLGEEERVATSDLERLLRRGAGEPRRPTRARTLRRALPGARRGREREAAPCPDRRSPGDGPRGRGRRRGRSRRSRRPERDGCSANCCRGLRPEPGWFRAPGLEPVGREPLRRGHGRERPVRRRGRRRRGPAEASALPVLDTAGPASPRLRDRRELRTGDPGDVDLVALRGLGGCRSASPTPSRSSSGAPRFGPSSHSASTSSAPSSAASRWTHRLLRDARALESRTSRRPAPARPTHRARSGAGRGGGDERTAGADAGECAGQGCPQRSSLGPRSSAGRRRRRLYGSVDGARAGRRRDRGENARLLALQAAQRGPPQRRRRLVDTGRDRDHDHVPGGLEGRRSRAGDDLERRGRLPRADPPAEPVHRHGRLTAHLVAKAGRDPASGAGWVAHAADGRPRRLAARRRSHERLRGDVPAVRPQGTAIRAFLPTSEPKPCYVASASKAVRT